MLGRGMRLKKGVSWLFVSLCSVRLVLMCSGRGCFCVSAALMSFSKLLHDGRPGRSQLAAPATTHTHTHIGETMSKACVEDVAHFLLPRRD